MCTDETNKTVHDEGFRRLESHIVNLVQTYLRNTRPEFFQKMETVRCGGGKWWIFSPEGTREDVVLDNLLNEIGHKSAQKVYAENEFRNPSVRFAVVNTPLGATPRIVVFQIGDDEHSVCRACTGVGPGSDPDSILSTLSEAIEERRRLLCELANGLAGAEQENEE